MRKRTLLVATVATVSVVAPVADALRVAPLKTRDAVVVTWRAQNKVAVVAQPDGRLLAVHALRKVAPGTRVTVSGIKWGTPLQGIKWGAPGRGVKWGIKWGRNGTYQSPLRKKAGKKAVWTPVRGPIVKRAGKKALAIGTPGGVVVVRLASARIAGISAKAIDPLPPVGATVSVRVFFGKNGVKVGRNLRYLKPPVPGAVLPFAGSVVSIDPATRTMVVGDDQDPAYPMRMTVALPAEFSLAPFAPGQEVAVGGLLAPDGSLAATSVGPNGDFTQADDPDAVQVLATGQPTCPNGVDGDCPTPPLTQTGSGASDAPAPNAGAPQPPSSSPSPPPSPSSPDPNVPSTPPAGPPPPGPPPAPACARDRDDDRRDHARPTTKHVPKRVFTRDAIPCRERRCTSPSARSSKHGPRCHPNRGPRPDRDDEVSGGSDEINRKDPVK